MTANVPENTQSTDTEVDADGNVTVKLYNANHGRAPRTGGPYRDDIEMEQAEVYRAKAEGREPDLDNPGPSAGTMLVPASQLVERDTDKMHYSERVPIENEPVAEYVVEPVKTEPDPAQADWDNDHQKVAALQGALLHDELIAKNNKADAEPSDETPDYLKDSDV